MALFHCNFFSQILRVSVSMDVILPEYSGGQIGMDAQSERKKHPTLYLLHGLSDDHTIWQRRTSIERYVAPLGLAVVMPAVNRSFYTDMAHGANYWTFISEELPKAAQAYFPLSDKREDNFVAGLSMGGYGALKLALRKPDLFAAGASLSGVVDVAARMENLFSFAGNHREVDDIFGTVSGIAGSDNDLFYLAKKVAEQSGPKPKIYQCCGKEDFLYQDNLRFRDFFQTLNMDYVYEEEPGDHSWGYWDMKIQKVLAWLPLKK